MHIGLIGGIGPAATDVYYRGLIKRAADLGKDLDLTIVHADAPTLLGNLAENRIDDQCAIYQELTKRLEAAGAQCVVVTSIAGHFCIDQFSEMSPLEVVGLPEAVLAALKANGVKTVGILGTQTVMESRVYGKLAPVEVLPPLDNSIGDVHDAYVRLATSGQSTLELRDFFFSEGKKLMDRGAEAVLLGGTDLNAAFSGTDCGFEIVDCAGIHIGAVAQFI